MFWLLLSSIKTVSLNSHSPKARDRQETGRELGLYSSPKTKEILYDIILFKKKKERGGKGDSHCESVYPSDQPLQTPRLSFTRHD